MYEYSAVVTKVVDGDTVHATVDLGCDVRINLTIRLFGIDTPELRAGGEVARDWLIAELETVGGKVVLRTLKDHREKYGRYLGVLFTNGVSGESVNDALIRLGMARVYLP